MYSHREAHRSVRRTAGSLVLLVVAVWMFQLGGCATLLPSFEKPSVTVTTFRPLPSSALAPSFEVGLRVANPNAIQLNLRGISYQVSLNGYLVADGAARDLPTIPAHGQAEFKVSVTVGLLEGVRFVNDLLKSKRSKVDYSFRATLDVGAMIPSINVEKTGSYVP